MEIKWGHFLMRFIGIMIVGTQLSSSLVAQAESNQSEGILGFYGIYESESEPLPDPPNGVENSISSSIKENNTKKLPQTGARYTQKWTLVGIILISLCLLYWRKKVRKF